MVISKENSWLIFLTLSYIFLKNWKGDSGGCVEKKSLRAVAGIGLEGKKEEKKICTERRPRADGLFCAGGGREHNCTSWPFSVRTLSLCQRPVVHQIMYMIKYNQASCCYILDLPQKNQNLCTTVQGLSRHRSVWINFHLSNLLHYFNTPSLVLLQGCPVTALNKNLNHKLSPCDKINLVLIEAWPIVGRHLEATLPISSNQRNLSSKGVQCAQEYLSGIMLHVSDMMLKSLHQQHTERGKPTWRRRVRQPVSGLSRYSRKCATVGKIVVTARQRVGRSWFCFL
jgi:hypothetical protein